MIEGVQNFWRRLTKQYFNKVFLIQLLVLYTCVIVISSFFMIKKSYEDGKRLEEKEIALFSEYIHQCDQMYRDMAASVADIKSLSSLDVFALAKPENYYAKMTAFQHELERFSLPYRRQGIQFAVIDERGSKVVLDSCSKSLDEVLHDWSISKEQYMHVIELLSQQHAPEVVIWTDAKVFYVTEKNYTSNKVYLVCYTPMSYMCVSGDVWENNKAVYFDSDSSVVLDWRMMKQDDMEVLDDIPKDVKVAKVGSGSRGNIEYLYFISRYYGVRYISVGKRDFSVFFVTVFTFLTGLGIVFLLLYFVTRRISRKVYKPIRELVQFTLGDQGDIEEDENPITKVHDKVRSLKEENQELQKRLDSLSHDIYITRQVSVEAEKQRMDSEELKRRLENYIADHLDQDISLGDVAQQFGISLSYMSILFKNKMDNNFKEYISYQRYLKSLSIMEQHPQILIKDVASQVGIQNVNTFIRIFKKYNGTTPKQYQNGLRGGT